MPVVTLALYDPKYFTSRDHVYKKISVYSHNVKFMCAVLTHIVKEIMKSTVVQKSMKTT